MTTRGGGEEKEVGGEERGEETEIDTSEGSENGVEAGRRAARTKSGGGEEQRPNEWREEMKPV